MTLVSRCRIARVGEGLLPQRLLSAVQLLEFPAEHEHLAAYFNAPGERPRPCQTQGKVAHRAHGLGHHFAHFPVAPGESLHHDAVLIGQFAGQPVQLGIGPPVGHDIPPGLGQGAGGLLHKGFPLPGGKHVVKSVHAFAVRTRLQVGQNGAAHSARGRIQGAQVGKLLFQIHQLAVQGIVGLVGDLRRIQLMVQTVVTLQLTAKPRRTGPGAVAFLLLRGIE